MLLRVLSFLFIVFFHQLLSGQELSAIIIPDVLKENANAVVRLNEVDVSIPSQDLITVRTTRVVTVLNENGLQYINAEEHYSASDRIVSIEAVVYDALGRELKKFKRKDFRDQSVSEGSVLTDRRVIYLHYTPAQYPFTVRYTSETQSSTTAFIPPWRPVEGHFASVEKSMLSIEYNPDLGFRYKEYNFGGYPLKKEQQGNVLTMSLENIPAIKQEDYAPAFQAIFPHALFSLARFNLEGIGADVSDWASFGAWMYKLIDKTDELPPATISKIKELTAAETDPLKKARIVYEYVQGKTRYISIQLGIGGWKPMLAKDVDRLGYGDCKALTNYTRALLKAVGVESYYTIVYGGRSKQSMREDFVSMQGNHAILAIPANGKYIWLECTSQTLPFGFQGDFTDDRLALVIKPGKGELVHTQVYDQIANTQLLKGTYAISDSGNLVGSFSVSSKGIQYDNKYWLESKAADDLNKYYKEDLSTINNLKLMKTSLTNNKDNIEFIEDLAVEAENYCSKSGNRFIFPVNAFNRSQHVPARYRSRKSAFTIERGYHDTDEVIINLPSGFTIEAMPQNVDITDKFGQYKTEYITEAPGRLLYKRTMIIKSGLYSNADYEQYRIFREKIAGFDSSKIVLIKN